MGPPEDGAVWVRMRVAVAETVTSGAVRLRSMSAPGLVGVLAASALAPVLAAVGGAGVVLTAGAGVLASVGTNVLTNVVTRAVERLRAEGSGVEPTPQQVQLAVAQRIAAAFDSNDPDDRELRGEVIALFRAVDIAGTALRAAAQADAPDLASRLVGAFGELAALFGEFAFVLVACRLSLEAMHQDLRQEIARQGVDREHARQAEADIGRILDLLRQPHTNHHEPTGAPGAGGGPGWDHCPYQGLLPFEERHATVFYGRRKLTSRLLHRLAEQLTASGVVLVLGPSGAGKSSLLRAGLMASLAADGLVYGCRWWPRRVLTPTGDPVRQLATHLADLAGIDVVGVYQALSDHPEQAHLLAAQVVTAHQHAPGIDPGAWPPQLVLVVDQLEELFSLVTDPTVRAGFLTALAAMATTPALPDGRPAALVVAGLRGDFLEQATVFTPIRDAVEAGPFTVGAMSESELREAITGPAAEAGVQVPDELATAILDDLRDRDLPVGFDSGALPLLSQAMFVLWQATHGDGLSVAGYRRTGGVATIVHTSAEQVYQALTGRQRELARRVFVHLTAASDGRLTRRPTTLTALRAAGDSGGDLEMVLEAFTAQRLITRTDSDMVAIAHEELLHSWTTLRDWLQPTITDQVLHRALVDDVHTWQEHDRDPSYLYRGSQLLAVRDAAHRWASDPTTPLHLDTSVTEFLATSHRRDQRRRRQVRATAIVIVMLMVASLATAVVAVGQRQAAVNAQRVALSRQLAAQSQTLADTNPDLAALLAVYAYRASPTREAVTSLFTMGWGPRLPRRRLTGHTDSVNSVAFSPDGKTLATGSSSDGTVRLWDVATGTTRTTLTGHTGSAYSVAFSPDGKTLAIGSVDSTVRLWDVATGTTRATLTGHTGFVYTVAFSPDGKTLATGSNSDGTVRLWDVTTGTIRATLTRHTGAVHSVAFSPDGKTLAVGSSSDTVRLWDVTTGTTRATLTGHTRTVHTVAFSPDGKTLATGSGDATVRLWDVATGTTRTTLTGHTRTVYTVAFSPDGKTLATGSVDSTVRLWDVATGITRATLFGHTSYVQSVAFSPDGKTLATGGGFNDTTVRLWDMVPGATRATLTGSTSPTGFVTSVAFSPDGKTLAAGSGDGRGNSTVRLWDMATGTFRATPTDYTVSVDSVAFSPDGKTLAIGSGDGSNSTVRVWDMTTGATRATLFGPTDPTDPTVFVYSVAFSPDGKTLAIGSGDGGGNATVRLWDMATGTFRATRATLTGSTSPTGFVTSVAFSPDGKTLATASRYDNTVRVWDVCCASPILVMAASLTVRLGGM